MGEKFVDLMKLDWKGMIAKKEVDPDTTIVFLDDEADVFERINGILEVGLRHVLVEDNFKYGDGGNSKTKASTPKQMFCAKELKQKGEWLFKNIVAYAEFPPLVPPIMAKAYPGERKKGGGFMVATDSNIDVVHPMLRPDRTENDKNLYNKIVAALGMDSTLKDQNSYMQFMNYNHMCHLELATGKKAKR